MFGNTQHKVDKCDICNKQQVHRHFSYGYGISQNQHSHIQCPICRTLHKKVNNSGAQLAIFSSSTLHNSFLYQPLETKNHVSFETQCGGRILDIGQQYQQFYQVQHATNRLLILAVTGLNDLHRSSNKIMISHMRHVKSIIEDNKRHKIIFVNLLTPPKLCNFNRPHVIIPDHMDLPARPNYLQRIRLLNANIEVLNDGIKFPMERYGCRMKGNKLYHKLSCWREAQNPRPSIEHITAEALHLVPKQQWVVTNNLIKFGEQLLQTFFDHQKFTQS